MVKASSSDMQPFGSLTVMGWGTLTAAILPQILPCSASCTFTLGLALSTGYVPEMWQRLELEKKEQMYYGEPQPV